MGLLRVIKFITQHPISGQAKLKSLYRFFWWQIRGLFTKKEYVHQFTKNSKLIISKGMTGATGNLYCGLHEYREMLFLLHYLKKGEIFVDVGANIGSYTILASAEIGATTYSFEPLPDTYNQLLNNININNIANSVKYYNIGLASKPGELLFSDEQDSSMNHVIYSTNDGSNFKKVKVSTLDSVLVDVEPSLLKIDVEGFELEVLKGAEKTLSSNSLKAIIIELNGSGLNFGHSDEDVHSLLLSYNFEPFVYDPFTRMLSKVKLHEFDNLIYIRDLEIVQNKLVNSPKFKILNSEI